MMLALEAGVHGYVVGEAEYRSVGDAVRAAHAGASYLSGAATGMLVTDYMTRQERQQFRQRIRLLSERESQVLEMIASGASTNSIAESLGLSPKTVATYRRRLMDKLDVASTSSLMTIAVRLGQAAQ
jgi:two-component system invasion response regulator UvrY